MRVSCRKGSHWAVHQTHLRIQLIDPSDGILDISPLNGTPDRHAILYAVQVDLRAETSLMGESLSGVLVAFNDEVVHDEAVEVTVKEQEEGGGAASHIWAREVV